MKFEISGNSVIENLKKYSLDRSEYFLDKDKLKSKTHIPIRHFVPYPNAFDEEGYLRSDIANIYIPENMNIVEFWKEATTQFPLLSICGTVVENKKFADYVNFMSAMALGLFDYVDEVFQKNPEAKILEIGPGYGALQKFLQMEYSDKNYYALDVVKLYDSDKIVLGDGLSFPEQLKNQDFDLIFSYNTFLHLSSKQRKQYFEDSYNSLKRNCHFILTCVMTPPEIPPKEEYLQTKDGTMYLHFLGQFVKIPTQEELIQEFYQFKYNISKPHGIHNEFVVVCLTKPE
jgi:hypothetical protein